MRNSQGNLRVFRTFLPDGLSFSFRMVVSSLSTNQGLLSNDPPWKDDLGLALKRGQRTTARYLSLATLGSGSPHAPDPLAPVPRVRTVVFRGWLWSTTCALTFITDARSDKMAHMGACEACWYFEKQREQFRIAGTLQAVGGAEEDAKLLKARAAAWRQLNGEAREQFYASAPGRPLGDTPACGSSADSHLDDDDPADTFGLLILWPTQVDQLRLARRQHGGERSPQRRWVHSLVDASAKWQTVEVVP